MALGPSACVVTVKAELLQCQASTCTSRNPAVRRPDPGALPARGLRCIRCDPPLEEAGREGTVAGRAHMHCTGVSVSSAPTQPRTGAGCMCRPTATGSRLSASAGCSGCAGAIVRDYAWASPHMRCSLAAGLAPPSSIRRLSLLARVRSCVAHAELARGRITEAGSLKPGPARRSALVNACAVRVHASAARHARATRAIAILATRCSRDLLPLKVAS